MGRGLEVFKQLSRLSWAGLACVTAIPSARGDIAVSYDGRQREFRGGTNAEEVVDLLSLKARNGGRVEAGGILRRNGSDVATSGDVHRPRSQTVTVEQLLRTGAAAGDHGFDLVLSIDEADPAEPVTLEKLRLSFTDAAGKAIPGIDSAASLAEPLELLPTGGESGSAGHVLHVRFSPEEWAAFVASPTNRIEADASITGATGGAENFFLSRAYASSSGNGFGAGSAFTADNTGGSAGTVQAAAGAGSAGGTGSGSSGGGSSGGGGAAGGGSGFGSDAAPAGESGLDFPPPPDEGPFGGPGDTERPLDTPFIPADPFVPPLDPRPPLDPPTGPSPPNLPPNIDPDVPFTDGGPDDSRDLPAYVESPTALTHANPEPSSLILMALGSLGLAGRAIRRNRRKPTA